MTTAQDISTMLPPAIRQHFEEHYTKQDPIRWDFLGSCSRCGASANAPLRTVHELWHKNLACQVWMISQWPVDHLRDHAQETAAFQAVIASILGFIDSEQSDSHVHEDGTTHDH